MARIIVSSDGFTSFVNIYPNPKIEGEIVLDSSKPLTQDEQIDQAEAELTRLRLLDLAEEFKKQHGYSPDIGDI